MTALKGHSLKMLSSAIRILKNWTLPIAMVAGGVGYPFFQHFSFLLPYLIFVMLTVTFCKVTQANLRITILHLVLTCVKNMKNALIKLFALLAIQEAGN